MTNLSQDTDTSKVPKTTHIPVQRNQDLQPNIIQNNIIIYQMLPYFVPTGAPYYNYFNMNLLIIPLNNGFPQFRWREGDRTVFSHFLYPRLLQFWINQHFQMIVNKPQLALLVARKTENFNVCVWISFHFIFFILIIHNNICWLNFETIDNWG